jgi:hypothetical protein
MTKLSSFKQLLQRQPKHTFYLQWAFCKNREHLRDNVQNYGKARQATDNIKRQPRLTCWIPQANKHTLRICNTHCFSMRTRHDVTLHVRCQSRLISLPSFVVLLLLQCFENTVINYSNVAALAKRPREPSDRQPQLEGSCEFRGAGSINSKPSIKPSSA